MAKNNVIVLDYNDDDEWGGRNGEENAGGDDSSDSDVEIIAQRRAAPEVDLQSNNRNDEVEFISSTRSARQQSVFESTSYSSDVQFVGTKRPRPSNSNISHRASFLDQTNSGGFLENIHRMFGFGGGEMMNPLIQGNIFGFGSTVPNYHQSMDFNRHVPLPRSYPSPQQQRRDNVSSKKKKAKISAKSNIEETTAIMKGKSMQRPQGFDAIDINYPRLKADDRTLILYNLLSNCTNLRYSKKFVHDFRVKFEKANATATLWSLAKAFSEEISRLEGDRKMLAKTKLLLKGEDGNRKENKPNASILIDERQDNVSDKKPMVHIGSLSGEVLNTLSTYFRAHLGQKDHKKMLDAIVPTESSESLTCCICSDDFDAGDTVACGGDDDIHFFCKPCLSSYCTVTLESGAIQSIPCAIPSCKSLFATHDIKSVLSDFDILKIEHREDSRDRRVALAAKAILHCECGVVAIVTEEDLGNGRIVCPGNGCGRRFCAKCGNVDHGNESCPPPVETVQWLDKHSKKCPNCSNRIEKNGGCNHMKCRPPGGCGHDFWWTCGCPFHGPHKCH